MIILKIYCSLFLLYASNAAIEDYWDVSWEKNCTKMTPIPEDQCRLINIKESELKSFIVDLHKHRKCGFYGLIYYYCHIFLYVSTLFCNMGIFSIRKIEFDIDLQNADFCYVPQRLYDNCFIFTSSSKALLLEKTFDTSQRYI